MRKIFKGDRHATTHIAPFNPSTSSKTPNSDANISFEWVISDGDNVAVSAEITVHSLQQKANATGILTAERIHHTTGLSTCRSIRANL